MSSRYLIRAPGVSQWWLDEGVLHMRVDGYHMGIVASNQAKIHNGVVFEDGKEAPHAFLKVVHIH